MSLKLFHFVFISLSVLLALGCAIGETLVFRQYGESIHLLLAAAAGIVAVGLVAYEVWFFRKTRNLIL
jgi:membrane protein DedA with SNARE-associated domain